MGARLEEMVKATLCVSNKLTFLAQGEVECPTLFVIRPVERARGVLCVKLDSLLTQEYELRFLCAYDYSPVEPAVRITRPSDFIKTAGPAVLMGLGAIKLALRAGKLVTGFKLDELVPGLGEKGTVGAALAKLDEFKGVVDEKLRTALGDEEEAADSIDMLAEAVESLDQEDVDEETVDALSKTQEKLTGPAYREVAKLAKEQGVLTRLPMTLMVDPQGNMTWVKNRNVDKWKKYSRGSRAAGSAQAKRAAAVAGTSGSDGGVGGFCRPLARCLGK
mmetsp:Transcript_75342/g.207881  ORF Transcript_75342/g.207881 Transcript_75342/m.207881 type:complete len:276 (+) Transcript_75342:951-1778(+)